MGYTHYWHMPRPIAQKTWGKIANDVAALLKASPIPVSWEYDEPNKPAEISPTLIRFNGIGDDDGHETFYMLNGPDDATFCKTERKPYDLLVCAVLIVAEKHAPKNIRVTSDGGMASFVADYPGPHDSEWDDALAFVHKVLGANYKLPRLIEFRK